MAKPSILALHGDALEHAGSRGAAPEVKLLMVLAAELKLMGLLVTMVLDSRGEMLQCPGQIRVRLAMGLMEQ